MSKLWYGLEISSIYVVCLCLLVACQVKFSYHNSEELEYFLKDSVRKYPHLTNLYSIGKSVQGRDLWVIALGADADKHVLLRPEVRYVGNIHGNEVTGREMLVHLVDHLLSNYHQNGSIKYLLDTSRIHILVSMNPDGFENATRFVRANNLKRCDGTHGRYNANGFDLNRNFPDFFAANSSPQQTEVSAMIDWFSKYKFILCGTLHDGALVANYPYDNYANASAHNYEARYSEAPDDDVFRHLAKSYSYYHGTMHRGKGCDGTGGKFKDGITNGAQWYPVKGGMQDYSYIFKGTYELTLELSCCKYPLPSYLEILWKQNKEAMIAFLQTVQMGIKGLVMDVYGNPIEGVFIKVKGRIHPVTTTIYGEYWRLLMPGKTYTIQVYKPNSNYIPQEKEVTINAFNAIIVNFTLETKRSSENGAVSVQPQSTPYQQKPSSYNNKQQQSSNSPGAVQTYRGLANSFSPPVFFYWMYYYR